MVEKSVLVLRAEVLTFRRRVRNDRGFSAYSSQRLSAQLHQLQRAEPFSDSISSTLGRGRYGGDPLQIILMAYD